MSLVILSGLVLDADAKAFINVAGVTGGIEKKAVNYLTKALKANGLWSKFYAIYPMIGGTAVSHSYNLKNTALYQITWANGPTHSSNGVDFNGTTQYGDTGLIADSVQTLNDTAIHIYIRDNAVSASMEVGASNGATQESYFITRNTGDAFFSDTYGSGGGRLTAANANSSGMFSASRESSTLHAVYRNGSSIGSNTTSQGTLPTVSYFIAALNNAGTAASYSTLQNAFAGISSGFTSAQASTLNTIIDTYQKRLSRNV